MTTIVYTDGSFSSGTGHGGWAWVTEESANFGGCVTGESSFAMEVRAVLEALRNLKGDLHIFCDAEQVVRLLNQHPINFRLWITGNKRKRAKFPLVHDLLGMVEEEMRDRKVTYEHVKGHNGDPLNTKADRLASRSMKYARSKENS